MLCASVFSSYKIMIMLSEIGKNYNIEAVKFRSTLYKGREISIDNKDASSPSKLIALVQGEMDSGGRLLHGQDWPCSHR